MNDYKLSPFLQFCHIGVLLIVLGACSSLTTPRSLEAAPTTQIVATPETISTVQSVSPEPTRLLAFPSAEGFGAFTPGGRGGRVIEVTTLDDSGPGSLRSAVDAEGPRTVIFRVGGTIELQSRLDILNPYITIAGQTAPGGGIMLRNAPGNQQTPIRIKSHDVILRYIRSRPGPSTKRTDTLDALEIKASHNVIIDHSSFSWSTDENVNIWEDSTNITIQWSIISEGLQNSTHIEGAHSKGLLIGSEGAERITIHHNLFAHNWKRNPNINTSGVVDVINNVVFNARESVLVQDSHATPKVNVIGNFFKRGPSNHYEYDVRYWPDMNLSPQIYVQGNISDIRPTDDLDEALVMRTEDRPYMVPNKHETDPVTITSACLAYEAVLLDAGATLPERDIVDERIVNDVINATGDVIDHPQQVGGWPTISSGEAPADEDRDGMPDAWEIQYGLAINDAADNMLDSDGDGYTNIEEYLNSTSPIGDAVTTSASSLQATSNNFYLPITMNKPLNINCDPRSSQK